jgi:hypothetical protein
MIRKIVLLKFSYFFFVGCALLNSRNNMTNLDSCFISGRVLDKETKAPIKVVVSLYTKKEVDPRHLRDSLVLSVYTNDSGFFFIEYPREGNFRVEFCNDEYISLLIRLGVNDVVCNQDTVLTLMKKGYN